MRTALIIAAAVAGIVTSVVPAAAQNYPWCRWGNHDCMYQSFAQCMAALSGTAGDCRLNPALQAGSLEGHPLQAYGAMPRRHVPMHHHRHHHHRHG